MQGMMVAMRKYLAAAASSSSPSVPDDTTLLATVEACKSGATIVEGQLPVTTVACDLHLTRAGGQTWNYPLRNIVTAVLLFIRVAILPTVLPV